MDTITINPKTYSFSTKEYKSMQNIDGTTYYHKFPVWKYKNAPTLECEVAINGESGEVKINVYDMSHVPYSPFYYIRNKGEKNMVDKIYQNIHRELKRLGITK